VDHADPRGRRRCGAAACDAPWPGAEGFAVDTAGDGTEGEWLARENPYDVVVLDVMLPGRDGYDVCARLRDAGIDAPVLMLTAKNAVSDEAHALDTGADDFLPKPFSYVVLMARLRALVRRGGARTPALLTAGDLTLDPAAHRVRRGTQSVDVTPRQLSLLEFLMRRAGDVLSKREILDHVWDFAYEGDPNIVEVYVRQLRLRIDEPFGRHALQTVRGAGLPAGPGGRMNSRSVRLRATLGATLLAALALTAAGVALVAILQWNLTRSDDDLARSRLADIAGLAASGDLPKVLRAIGDDSVAQVVADDGTVLARSPNILRAPRIAGFSRARRPSSAPSADPTTRRPRTTGSGGSAPRRRTVR
jgi:DNA-binding response OmpR family regulator